MDGRNLDGSRGSRSKNLVLCFDGTANRKDIRTGFGEFHDGGWFCSSVENVKSDLDELVAFSVDYHVIEAYTYLMRYYVDGDRVYLFGFSRGSFIARILAGMIERIGLLNQGLEVMVSTAWEIYKKWEQHGQPIGREWTNSSASVFKKTFCREKVIIKFMGLWDSVNSCGIFRDRLFPFTSISHHVEHIRHAVSIDERRAKFKQNLFLPHSYLPSLFNLQCIDQDAQDSSVYSDSASELDNLLHLEPDYVNRTHAYANRPAPTSNDLVELWFPGDHSDVGGGWANDIDGHSISNLPFRWILASAIEMGVLFKKHAVYEFATKFTNLDSLLSCNHDCLQLIRNSSKLHDESEVIAVHPPAVSHNNSFNSSIVTAQSEDLFHQPGKNVSQIPPHPVSRFVGRGTDTVLKCLFWWMVEVLPVGYFIENRNGKWRRIYYPNLGRTRNLPRNARLHWTALWRTRLVRDYEPKNLPEFYRPLFDQVKAENEGRSLSEDEDVCDCQVLTNENLIDRTTGEIKQDCLVCEHSKKTRIDIRWDEFPDDLSKWLEKDPNL
ncbi:hypothetical protein KL930_005036 [Ogataea haglerorum]|uniref:T6SS Phospholipase effector Tle1-like catalytic domain-containing protein n=1 Tax=Ogataea haglerorum TaxID=1937702 RepID=A0AAN6HYY4_9ASCO|nr:uncharacterized protein KL911_005057 [Ogataea haglerorum]KAG7702516.1 hypothetical protein KL914_005176 [Ogataea haglerorum]KAG7702616.1 hypothetical protein KL950_005161 [Ogataea haglerorum]KAG7713319.1 hypothetical protein KL913_005119 [Ogataea haglerorum]KAG7713690.1 hypothetical protein KL949_005157 [Ogataea haglerorum]KAG7724095.1 hypothetical protein KL933_005057 [Ogataea haglerorum]